MHLNDLSSKIFRSPIQTAVFKHSLSVTSRSSFWSAVVLASAVLISLCGCTGDARSLEEGAPNRSEGVGRQCEAGLYSCTLPKVATLGSQCSCPGLGAPSYGVVHP